MTETTETAETWLTQDAYDRLKAELDNLTDVGRPEIIAKIEAAREEGDLKENGGYHAAKEEQGKAEARIRQLTQLLRDAKVGSAPARADVAVPGSVVTVRFEGDDDEEVFLLGSREDRVEGYAIYSPSSPLGHAVLGHGPGDVVTYEAPRKSMKVTIVSVGLLPA